MHGNPQAQHNTDMNTGKHIVIDIGHARNTGARGNGYEEHARCGQTAARLAERLRAAGYAVTVLDYPERTNRGDLAATVAAANGIGRVDFGISLHMDAAADPQPQGAHVCYVSETGRRMAEAIAAPLCKLLPGRACAVVRRTDLYVLNHTLAPWVLCECGFITNPGEAEMAPEAVADVIARGVNDYFAG